MRIVVSNPYTFMSSLKNGHFQNADVLNEVVITNQRLQELGARVFEGAKTITTIILDNDMIENVDENAFDNLETLEVLSISHNTIKNLPMKTFEKLEKLKNLDLSSNMISWLQRGIFTDTRDLRKVNFARNWFLRIDEVTMFEGTHYDFTNSFCIDNFYKTTTQLNEYLKTNCKIEKDILPMFQEYKNRDDIDKVCSEQNTPDKVRQKLEQTKANKSELIKRKADLEEEIVKVKIYRNSLC